MVELGVMGDLGAMGELLITTPTLRTWREGCAQSHGRSRGNGRERPTASSHKNGRQRLAANHAATHEDGRVIGSAWRALIHAVGGLVWIPCFWKLARKASSSSSMFQVL
eukprot:CAMPEP_0206235954 /NCGR_PEP_ID=MMETSP0047_2-20121206/13443_1 /ASSEMBLY_ACC=CAM_ASM_000192 /TAXON_ID=195065 /ORGANISM="Chroomonas mesostigmatica_cf, Strain CCMP1168" /LENGTH=108 /DNA_ID=CAMNT_0053660229 /DNA_START=75 /DNA_END=401 /DNA_ORIENTATION=+